LRKVFVDCGTNLGGGINHFNNRYHFGPDWEIYLFEPNPYLKDFILKNIVSANPQIPIYLIDRAVCGASSPAEVEFKLQKIPEHEFPAGGGSTFMSSNDGFLESETADYENVKVQTIRLSEFIMHVMSNHVKVRDSVAEFQKGECMIALKLDIEGAEYEVIQDLLDTGTAWAITDLHVEFHGRRFAQDKREEEVRLVGELFQRGVNIFSHF
jgi:FkbM family methyltransferase